MTFYVHYQDDGPAGVCGQSMEITRCRDDLLVFPDRETARPFLEKIERGTMTGALRPRIVKMWDDEVGWTMYWDADTGRLEPGYYRT
jgi:hypothetical protein